MWLGNDGSLKRPMDNISHKAGVWLRKMIIAMVWSRFWFWFRFWFGV
jgi:hypothetical protein